MPFSARKMHFFDENGNLPPWPARASSDFKDFFPMVFFYLNSEGFFPAKSGTWLNPPLNVLNLAKNGPILKIVRKKVFKIDCPFALSL